MSDDIYSRKIQDTPIVVFDFETTGFTPRAGDEIIEIGALKSLGGKIVETYETLVNPIRPISQGASEVNGITRDMVANAPLIEDALPELLKFIGECPLTAHNAAFDLSFLAWKMAEMGLPEKSNPVFDTMLLSRALNPTFYNHKLGGIIAQLGIEMTVGHRALSDAEATHAVLQKMLAPYAADGELTVARALSLQGGPVAWPGFRHAEVTPGPETEIEAAIRLAIERGGTVVIEYQTMGSDKPTKREIRPIHLSRRPVRTYLIADCLLRNAQRIFRVDRIANIIEP
ncbi:MAG: exonuclease domain-containing protein [bacterium]